MAVKHGCFEGVIVMQEGAVELIEIDFVEAGRALKLLQRIKWSLYSRRLKHKLKYKHKYKHLYKYKLKYKYKYKYNLYYQTRGGGKIHFLEWDMWKCELSLKILYCWANF